MNSYFMTESNSVFKILLLQSYNKCYVNKKNLKMNVIFNFDKNLTFFSIVLLNDYFINNL